LRETAFNDTLPAKQNLWMSILNQPWLK